MDKLEMPLEQFVQAVVKENERLRDILKTNTEQQAEHIKSLLESWEAERNTLTKEIERLRAALELYRDAVRIDVTMEGPKFMGANSSALKRAWDADRAALGEEKREFTEGHCEHKKAPGGCQLHNLHCGYPDCDRRPT